MWLHALLKACMLQVVAQHLFQEGRFAVGEAFLREAKLPYGQKLKAPFAAMHSVLQSVRLYPKFLKCWGYEHGSALCLPFAGMSAGPDPVTQPRRHQFRQI